MAQFYEDMISLVELASLLGLEPSPATTTRLRRRIRSKERLLDRKIAQQPGRKIFLSKSDLQAYFPEWVKKDQQVVGIVREEIVGMRDDIRDLTAKLNALASRVLDNKRQIKTLSPKG